MINMDDYLIIDTNITYNGESSTQLQSIENDKHKHKKLIIKQYCGVNTDNFIISKIDGKKLIFGIFTINGIYYINLNGEHIIDYNKFIHINKISYNAEQNCLKITNNNFGEIYISNCDLDIFNKAMIEISNYMKHKTSLLSNIFYYIFSS